MNPSDYQRLASRTECDQEAAARKRHLQDSEGDPKLLATRLSHAVLGLTGEVGELAGAIERWLHYGKELDRVNIAEEVGDSLWYLALACNALGISMEDVMSTNIAKLRKRYPEKYTNECAAEENRDRAAEREVLEGREPWGNPDQPWKHYGLTEEQWNQKIPEVSVVGLDSTSVTTLEQAVDSTGRFVVGVADAQEQDYTKPPLDESYPKRCSVCKVARIHKTNSTGLCTDCGVVMRARLFSSHGVD